MGDASTDRCPPLPRASLEERRIRHRLVDQTLDDCLHAFFHRQSTLRELTAAPVESRESESAMRVYGRYHHLRRQGCWVRAADPHQEPAGGSPRAPAPAPRAPSAVPRGACPAGARPARAANEDGGARQPQDGAHPGETAARDADPAVHGPSAEPQRDPAWAWASSAISGLPRLPDCEEYAMVISPSASIWQGGADQGNARSFLACLGAMCGAEQPEPVLVQAGACSIVAVARAVGGGADHTAVCSSSVDDVQAWLCRLTVPGLRALSAGGTLQKVARGSADAPLRLAAVALNYRPGTAH